MHSTATQSLKNIGPKERRLRLILGIFMFIFSIALGLYFCLNEQPTLIRLAVFIPFFFAYMALFQAQSHICVVHGFKGTCHIDAGPQKVEDAGLRAKLWSKSVMILIKSALFAAIWTLLVLAFNNRESLLDYFSSSKPHEQPPHSTKP